jgi:two-component system CheB/CheR fusion protein
VSESSESTGVDPRDDDFGALLRYLKDARGFDFTGYKRTSLMRRVSRRMSQVGLDRFDEYIDRLEVDADEFGALFNTILINVTAFFRDPETWEFLRTDALPTLLAARAPEAPIRVWSAGCASGQEAYSLAILLAEVLGPAQYRQRVKIYATDVDDEALSAARHAVYDATALEGVGPALLEKYFERNGERYVFRKDLRRTLIFGRNDLVQDAPISRIDLLACRNTLMYFNAETQKKILNRLHFALAPRGLLFLGRAEMLLTHAHLFDPFDLRRRIFRRVSREPDTLDWFTAGPQGQGRQGDVAGLGQLRELAFGTGTVAQVVVTGDDTIALVNQQAEAVFGLSERDVGQPLRDLELSYRPVELRGYLDQVRSERRAVEIKDVEMLRSGGKSAWFDIHLRPLLDSDDVLAGLSIVFHDVSSARVLQEELERVERQLEAAYEQLQSTNEELRTTNEELQSTVEELETTNEELQSTNEELETMNEELQSTNDELRTINDMLRVRGTELDEVNNFLESILTSIHSGIVVVDREMQVLVWNRIAEDLWGLSRGKAEGADFLGLDIGLPVRELRGILSGALADTEFSTAFRVSALDRRGRRIDVRLLCSALRTPEGASKGAILMMEAPENQV